MPWIYPSAESDYNTSKTRVSLGLQATMDYPLLRPNPVIRAIKDVIKRMEDDNMAKLAGITPVEEHMKILNELNELYAKKNHDYGDSFHQSFTEEGWAMVRIRLGDKFNRMKTLTRSTDSAQVKDESLRDTLMDLANYAVMTVMEIDRIEEAHKAKQTQPGSRLDPYNKSDTWQ